MVRLGVFLGSLNTNPYGSPRLTGRIAGKVNSKGGWVTSGDCLRSCLGCRWDRRSAKGIIQIGREHPK